MFLHCPLYFLTIQTITMPTVDIPDKICPHCGNTKWYWIKAKPHLLICKQKRKEIVRASLLRRKEVPSVKEATAKRLRKWKDKNREHIRQYERDYVKRSDIKRKCKNRSAKRSIDNLSDRYIKLLIVAKLPVKVPLDSISQNHIELHRNRLILKRKLKITQHGKNKKQNN